MTIRILKYPAEDLVTEIKGCVRVLSVQLQRGRPTIWAEVHSDDDTIVRINAFATGEDLPVAPGRYVSTVVSSEGALVFHFYASGETS